ncbi:stage III sporulation protein AF [Bacillus horti]|uniref:Stage III sporulation protein AF n=2 Tax=Caldalkalibacillus horti TaxID=77523 RepID=A0ABT9W0T2_9BACI|nr:stage III sporulation protein AF [Bacillus horti]MDQ0166882.1 stage III sporulation protein AF [Bacillus horti]
MSFLAEWIRHIVLLILLATFLDLIIPNSSMRKYVKLVVGFLLILIILSPILQLLNFDHDRLLTTLEDLLGGSDTVSQQQLEREQQALESVQDELLLEEVKERWLEEIKIGIEAAFDVKVSVITIGLDHYQSTVLVNDMQLVLLEKRDAPNGQTENTDQREVVVTAITPIKPIEEVAVHEGSRHVQRLKENDERSSAEKKVEKEVLKFVQDEWNISVDKIHIAWSRG